ncbi:MAG: translation elongation factor Ts [Patescibacteria group bacterium]|jgi:elongation factor Ts|nr:translation elongation factor Ts [Patescibacteria group bacterium]
MELDANIIKELREKTGAGILDCRKALGETNGDIDQAIDIIKKSGKKIVAKKQDRATNAGLIEAYIHGEGRIGVLVEIVCETDFVARNPEFKNLAHEVAMQIAAMAPEYVSADEIPVEVVEKEKEIYRQQLAQENKPAEVAEKIIEGKLNKFYEEVCLLNQKFIKDDKKTVQVVVEEVLAKLKENIKIKRFVRFSL